MTRPPHRVAFLAICLMAATGSGAYLVRLARLPRPPALSQLKTVPLDRIDAGRPGILFRSTVPGATFGHVAFVPLAAAGGPWQVSPLICDRVYYQGGAGVCVTTEPSRVTPHVAFVFDDGFRPGARHPLAGMPSRARVSPDGRRAAITVFESGESYAESGFETRTTVLDARSGDPIADLAHFTVFRDGVRFAARDFNFWGVSFARDGNRFYATVQSRGTTYLLEGDVDRRTARVVGTGVECPSLSPDNRRLAFKQRMPGNVGVRWHVAILDLQTMSERVLDAEKRSVDDQVEWLDDSHVLYHLPTSHGADIWVLDTDRAEAPRLLIPGGYSPAVVR